jgi:hypothetical protein
MPPTGDHAAQHCGVHHLIFRNENPHGIPPSGKTKGSFLSRSNCIKRANNAIFIFLPDIVLKNEMWGFWGKILKRGGSATRGRQKWPKGVITRWFNL